MSEELEKNVEVEINMTFVEKTFAHLIILCNWMTFRFI